MKNEIDFNIENIFNATSKGGALYQYEAKKYYIAPYQRGYKWAAMDEKNDAVCVFMNDLIDASKTADDEYRLQFITTRRANKIGEDKNVLEVIDGQQRLTTLTILLSVLEYIIEGNTENAISNNKLSYEIRKKVSVFFQKHIYRRIDTLMSGDWKSFIIEYPENDEQDIFYLYDAAQKIKKMIVEKFSARENCIRNFREYVKEHVKIILICIEDDHNINCEEIFSNLNDNKVELKSSELVKGLILTEVSRLPYAKGTFFDKEKIELRELRANMGRQWDEISHWANREDIGTFFFDAKKDKDNVLDKLLTLLAVYDGFNELKMLDKKSSKNVIFSYFQSQVKDGEKKVKDIFDNLKEIKSILNDWFNKDKIYNYLGYVFFRKNDKKEIQFFFEQKDNDGLPIIRYGKSKLIKYLEGVSFESLKTEEIDTLVYSEDSDKDKMHDLLLAINVFGYENRFDFTKFVNEEWSLEHILPQNLRNFGDKSLEKEEIELLKFLCEGNLGEFSRAKKLLLGCEEIGNKEDVYNSLSKKLTGETCALNKDEEKILYKLITNEKLHRIGNMALLSRKDNSYNSNRMFCEKREKIVKRIKEGSFVPKHTYDVFSKLIFGNGTSDLTVWTEKDIDEHAKFIKDKVEEIKGNYIPDSAAESAGIARDAGRKLGGIRADTAGSREDCGIMYMVPKLRGENRMDHGLYSLGDFLKKSDLRQIIIPEIQRDYVWKPENVKRFLRSIDDNYKEKNNNYQIGFIYAYQADDMLDGCYILIDGQQRLTTLFLILLALSVKEDRRDYFRRFYFTEDNNLKLDYKVRESSHEFLQKFVQYILDEKSIEKIDDEYWNFAEYQNDVTDKSIIENYNTIWKFINTHEEFIDTCNLTFDYVEKHVKFWYYDTSESYQGEKLYLYMNSRGETVRSNESIKANLLRKCNTDEEKYARGEDWEKWQNLFWRYRHDNPNADKGMDEFLKWIKFIELTFIELKKSNKKESKELFENVEKKITEIKKSEKIDLDELLLDKDESLLDKINGYYIALDKLKDVKDESIFNMYWLAGYYDAGNNNAMRGADYIRLIPMLMYVKKHPEFDHLELKRFARFFLNITRFKTIDNHPYYYIVEVILLTKSFLDAEYTDITEITNFEGKYKSILTDEEIHKLKIYKQNSGDLRLQIEDAFWSAEDFHFCGGSIWLIWKCIDYDCSHFDSQKLEKFEFYSKYFNILFEDQRYVDDDVDNLVRRALLTKGNYIIYDGYSAISNKSRQRFSFISKKNPKWKEHLSSKSVDITPYKELIEDFGERWAKDTTEDTTDDTTIRNKRKAVLEQIIASPWSTKVTDKDWEYHFIKEPKYLKFCAQQMICEKDEGGDFGKLVLLRKNKVRSDNDWKYLETYQRETLN
jgi:uncharacterized protein with ParB-like and HNH nuclease domain